MNSTGINNGVGSVPADQFDALDDPVQWPAFGRPASAMGAQWQSMLQVDGMTCALCASQLEQALLAMPGVGGAQVSAGQRSARVVWSPSEVKLSDIFRTVQRAGYQALPANDSLAREKRQRESRLALWRWLVAGLCMMQVMMYAYPAYIAGPGDLQSDQAQLLRWASWVLTLPVIAFCALPFFKVAWRDALQGRLGMDTPVALAILITFAVSTVATFQPEGAFGAEVYFDSLTMFVFFLLTGRWLELRLRDRTAGSLESLMNRLPDSVLRRRRSVKVGQTEYSADTETAFERVPARQLVFGDVIQVLPGEAFAADGEIIFGSTEVDEALLTGESTPLSRRTGDSVIAGSFNRAGSVQVRVNKVGADTRFAQIVNLMEEAATSKPRIAVMADRVAGPFLVAVMLAAAGALAFWWPQDPQHAWMVAVSVLVVTCPCALSLATPAAMMAASGTLARAGMLVRQPNSLEALSGIDTVVFDKTGTLTQDKLMLDVVRAHRNAQDGGGDALAMAVALARHSLHPAAQALVASAELGGFKNSARIWAAARVRELPGRGLVGQVWSPGPDPSAIALNSTDDGAVRVLRLGSATHCGVAIGKAKGPVGDEAFSRQIWLSDDKGTLASFELSESLRADAVMAVEQLRSLGCDIDMLSGDQVKAVDHIAAHLGIDSAWGDCRPEEKLDELRRLRKSGKHVAMVGDGINDGPALAAADVSIAMGHAVPVAQSRADLIIQGGQLIAVPQAVAMARKTMQVVRQNLVWAAIYNFTCVPLALAGLLPAWLAGLGMATSSLLVVLNAMRLTTMPELPSKGVKLSVQTNNVSLDPASGGPFARPAATNCAPFEIAPVGH